MEGMPGAASTSGCLFGIDRSTNERRCVVVYHITLPSSFFLTHPPTSAMLPGRLGWINANLGICRCERNRPLSACTTIHRRSISRPRASASDASRRMPLAALTG